LPLALACEAQQIVDLVIRFHTAYVNKNSLLVTNLGKVIAVASLLPHYSPKFLEIEMNVQFGIIP
jgi:predicted transcriptional regulator